MADNGNEDEDSELEEEQKDPDESLRGLNWKKSRKIQTSHYVA
jgi:hypothetical protein